MKRIYLKRIFTLTAAFLVFALNLSSISVSAYSFTPISGYDDEGNIVELSIKSEAVYMINMDSGETIVDIDSNSQRIPASLTKIMTAILLLDEFDGDSDKLESTIYSAGSEAFDELYGTGASTADIQPYEEVNCLDLLYALMLPSACEAANIIAIGISGSLEDFTELMNEKAAELGMNDTHFSCAHGLDTENNYTTCQDVAKMCLYAVNSYPLFNEVVSTYSYTMSATDYHTDGTDIYNTNLTLLSSSNYYDSDICGIKTGTLEEAGRCFASYASYDGVRYLTVTMGAPLEKTDEDTEKGEADSSSIYAADTVYYNLIDHINLYEWAYEYIDELKLVDSNSEVREAKVEYGEDGRDYVALKPAEDFSVYFPSYISEDEITREITVYDNIVAPVYQGDQLGVMTLSYQGEVIAEIPLVATESVNRSAVSENVAVAKAFPSSNEFKIALCVIAIFIIIFVIVHIVRVQNRYKK